MPKTIIKPQQAAYTIQTTGAIEQMFLDKPKATARLIYIYPGIPQSTGLLKANSAAVTVGLYCDGQLVVTDVIAATDPPLKFPLPDSENVTTLLSNFIIKGTSGDGVLVRFWDDEISTML